MIQLRIKSESDLYNPFDPSRVIINNEIYSYLKSFCTETEAKKHTFDKLQVISGDPIDADRFKDAVHRAFQHDQDEYDRQIGLNNKRALWGYVIGVSLSIAGFVLSALLDQVLLEIISFFGTMTVREAIVMQTKVNPDIKRLRRRLDPFRNIELEVVNNKL